MTCNHGRGPITGIEHGWIRYYVRPISRLFRKKFKKQCFYCGEVRDDG